MRASTVRSDKLSGTCASHSPHLQWQQTEQLQQLQMRSPAWGQRRGYLKLHTQSWEVTDIFHLFPPVQCRGLQPYFVSSTSRVVKLNRQLHRLVNSIKTLSSRLLRGSPGLTTDMEMVSCYQSTHPSSSPQRGSLVFTSGCFKAFIYHVYKIYFPPMSN